MLRTDRVYLGMIKLCECAHQHGEMQPPMAQSAGGWCPTQLEFVSIGLRHPLVPPDPDSQVEVLRGPHSLKGESKFCQKKRNRKAVHTTANNNFKYQHVGGCRILWQCCQRASHTSFLKGRKATLSSPLLESHSTGSLYGHHHPLR